MIKKCKKENWVVQQQWKRKSQAKQNFCTLHNTFRQKFCKLAFCNLKCKSQATTETLFILTEIIMVLAAGFLIFGKLNSISEDNLFVKKFFARDIAVLLDAMHVPQGNILYFYTTNQEILSKLSFTFSNQSIEVNNEKYPTAVHLAEETTIEKPTHIRVLKKNNKLFVEKEKPIPQEQYNKNTLVCPQTPILSGTIILDAGHGYNPTEHGYQGNKGVEGQHGQESILMARIAQTLESLLKLRGRNVVTTRALTTDTEDAKTIEERKKMVQQGDIILSIHANKDKKENNNIKAYINHDSANYIESYSFACALLNTLSDTFVAQTTGTAIIPVKMNQLDNDDDKKILETNKIAVQIEIGNIDATSAFLLQTKNAATAIAQVLT